LHSVRISARFVLEFAPGAGGRTHAFVACSVWHKLGVGIETIGIETRKERPRQWQGDRSGTGSTGGLRAVNDAPGRTSVIWEASESHSECRATE